MPDTVETAVYKLGLDDGQYRAAAQRKQQADQGMVSSAERVAVSEEKVTRATRASATSLERRLARLDPAIAAEQRYTRALQAHERFEEAAIGTAAQRTRLLELETEAYQRRTAALARTTVQMGRANHVTRNLSYQLVDIGQALTTVPTSGIYAFQNLGFQIAQIGQLYAGQGGLKAAITDSAAQVTRFAAKLGPLALAAGAIGVAFVGMRSEIERSTGVAVTFGDVALGVWQTVRDGIYNTLRPAIDAITPWFATAWEQFVGDVKTAGNEIIGIFAGAYEYIIAVWRNLPAALSGLAKQAVNGVLDVFSQDLLTFGGKTLIPGLNASGLKFDLTDAESSALTGANAAFQRGSTQDYLGGFFSSVEGRAVENARQRLEDADETAKKAKTSIGRAANDNLAGWNSLRGIVGGFINDLRRGAREGKSMWETIATAAQSAFDRILDAFIDRGLDSIFAGGKTGQTSGPLGFLARLLGGGISSGASSAIAGRAGLFADGGVFQQSGVVPFARGGVVSSPTVFPFANGIGLMGERGPEAILPLRRSADGRLGVSANNDNGGVVVQNIDQRSNGAPVETSVSRGPNGETVIRNLIRDEVVRMSGTQAGRSIGLGRKVVAR